jgi:hypothetical protein
MSETAGRKYTFDELGQLDSLDVDALRSMFALEVTGEQFYNALADRVYNEQAAELLRRNGREEAGHARRIERALAIKLGHPFTPTPDLLEPAVIQLPERVGADLLRVIVQAEFDGDAGYQRWADNEALPEVERLLRLNGREETIHGRRVEQAIALMNP